MKVPYTDLKSQYNEIKPRVLAGIERLMDRGDFILGKDTIEFENAFARYIGAPYACGVNSGTDALFLGLLALGVGPGDEVIVPAFTYIASAFAVTYTGAKPVFVDIDDRTFNMDTRLLRKALTEKTKAIMPVHLYGQCADMAPVLDLAREKNIAVIEDAAQAHGAEYRGKKAGALGDIGAFSFYPTKNLGASGDAGIMVTSRKDIFEKMRKLRDYGRKTRYEHETLGYNSRLDSIQALILSQKLRKLDSWNNKRRAAARLYRTCLQDTPSIRLPLEADHTRHIYHIFAVRLRNRDAVLQELKKQGISAMVHYPVPLHLQEVYKGLGYKEGDFPVAEMMSKEVLCLPMFPHIKKNQIAYVAKKLKGSL